MMNGTEALLRGVRYHRESGRLLHLNGTLENPFASLWVDTKTTYGLNGGRSKPWIVYITVLDEREVAFAKEDYSAGGFLSFVQFFGRFRPITGPELQELEERRSKAAASPETENKTSAK